MTSARARALGRADVRMGMEPEDVYRSDVAGCDGATWAEQIPATRLASRRS